MTSNSFIVHLAFTSIYGMEFSIKVQSLKSYCCARNLGPIRTKSSLCSFIDLHVLLDSLKLKVEILTYPKKKKKKRVVEILVTGKILFLKTIMHWTLMI